MPDVQIRVGASIDSTLASALQPVLATARRARQAVQSEAEAASKAQQAEFDKAAKAGQKAYQQTIATAEKAAAREAAAAERAAQQKTRADLKAFDQKLKASSRAAAQEERDRNREAAAAERAAQRKTNADLRAFDQRLRASARASAQEERDILRVAATAERAAARQAATAAKASAAADKNLRQRGVDFARNAAGNFAGIAGAAGRLGLGVARGMGVNTDVGSAVGGVVAQQQIASQIANSGYLEGDERNGVRQSPTALHHEAREAAKAAGLGTEDVLGGLQQMVGKSSDLATSREILGDMAKLAKALGANMEDVGAAAGEVSLRLGDVPNKAQVITNIMAVIAQQGKVGAIEMRDMAKNLGTVMASAGKFGEGPEQAAKDLGALFQVAKKGGSKNAAQSATGVASFVAGLTNPAELKRLSAMGINVFSNKEHTKFNSVGQIAAAALLKTGGDLGKLGGTFKNQRAMSVVSGLGQVYGDAEKAEKGSGVGAIKSYFEKMGKGMSQEDLADSLKLAMDTTATKTQQFNTALEEVGEKLADKLLPALERLAPFIIKAADAFATLVGEAVENPGTAITAAIVASIGKAAIGSAVAAAIKALIGGGGGGAGGVAGVPGRAGAYLGAAGIGIALGSGAIIAGAENADAAVERAGSKQDEVQAALKRAHEANRFGMAKGQEVVAQGVGATVTNLNERIRIAEMSQGLSGFTSRLTGNMSGDEYASGRKDLAILPELKAMRDAQLNSLKALTTTTLKVQVVNMPKGGGPGAQPGFDAGEPMPD